MIPKTVLCWALVLLILWGCCPRLEPALYPGDHSRRQELVSFVLVGDTQRTSAYEFWREQNDPARRAVLERIASENPAFVVLLGDIVSWGSNRCHWQQFDDYAAQIRDRGIPVFPVPGNHDYYGPNDRALGHLFSRFPHLKGRTWISLRYRSIGVILVDSNFGEQEEKKERERQHNWYLKQLEAFQNDATIRVILVACHHSPYTNSKVVRDSEAVREAFVYPFDRTPKAKLFFSGHCHSYEHFVRGGKHFTVSGGGGGPRHRLEIDPEKRRYPDTYRGGPLRAFHFCRLTLLSEGIRAEMVRLNADLNGWSVGETFVVRWI